MLAYADTATGLALAAIIVMLAYAGATAGLAPFALPAVLADASTAACCAFEASLVVRTLLPYAPLYWMRCWGFRRCCRSCWGCRIHGVMAASTICELWRVAF